MRGVCAPRGDCRHLVRGTVHLGGGWIIFLSCPQWPHEGWVRWQEYDAVTYQLADPWAAQAPAEGNAGYLLSHVSHHAGEDGGDLKVGPWGAHGAPD